MMVGTTRVKEVGPAKDTNGPTRVKEVGKTKVEVGQAMDTNGPAREKDGPVKAGKTTRSGAQRMIQGRWSFQTWYQGYHNHRLRPLVRALR